MSSYQFDQTPTFAGNSGPSMDAPQAAGGHSIQPALDVARDRILELAMARALAFHEAGRLSDAEDLYRVVLAEQPNHLAANANMARMALELQDPQASLPFLRIVVDANPTDLLAWSSYISALLESHEFIDAQETLQQCRKQGFSGTTLLRLVMCMSLGVEAWLTNQSRTDDANIRSKPKAHRDYQDLCRADVPDKEQGAIVALFNDKDLAKIGAGALDLAIRFPIASFSWKRLADAYQLAGVHDSAEAAYLRSIKLDPTVAAAHFSRALNLSMQGKIDAAESSYREAIRIKPDHHAAINNLICILSDQGKFAEAEDLGREMVRLLPDDIETYSKLLFMLDHRPTITPQELFAEHRRFGEHFEGPLRATWPTHSNTRDPNRQLKIGFVSGDFRNHSVTHFIEPILTELVNCKQLELHAYYNNVASDSTTQRLMRYMPHWNRVAGMNDVELAKKIKADAIDILFDLSGITTFHRLATFARKPAPIQVSWIGYPGTTGLQAMDYFFADQNFLPEGEFDTLFTEKIVRLLASCPFQPFASAPPLNNLPALQNGYCTFGSFNRLGKITEEVVELWSQLIVAVPGSKMVLGGIDNERDETRFYKWFGKNGVSPDRLIFRRRCGLYQYLKLHHMVDICLDTFPYGGGTTIWHAIWMGVPTLTLALGSSTSQSGASVLRHMGLQEFIARDRQEFLSKGLKWASRPQELMGIRKSMRERFSRTPTGNPERLAQDLQVALGVIWRRWCAGLPAISFGTQQ